MSSTPTFGGVIESQPDKVLVVETNQETGAFTFKDNNDTVIATIAEPEQTILPVSFPFSDYSVSASVAGTTITTASSNTLDVTIATTTVRTLGYTGAKVKIVVVTAPGNFSIAGSNVTNGFTY